MSTIRMKLAYLNGYFKAIRYWTKYYLALWWRRYMTDKLCFNCGTHSIGMAMTRCRMVDRCIPSQNSAITEHYTGPQLERMIYRGERIYAYEGRPLCLKCAEANNYVCWICELEKIEEEKNK